MEISLSRRCSKPGKLGGWERLVRTLPQVQGVCRDRFHLDTCNVSSENCKRLTLVDLSSTETIAIWGSTFSQCVNLVHIWFPTKLRRIGKEAFMSCASLQEVYTPPALQYIAHRAFFDCEQLTQLIKMDDKTTWRGPYAESNTFEHAPTRTEMTVMPLNAFNEELHKGTNGRLPGGHLSVSPANRAIPCRLHKQNTRNTSVARQVS